jgi:ADP-heptose:LPS heptosyltransferase
MQLINPEGLIGDTLSTVPVMIDLAKEFNGLDVLATNGFGHWIYDLIPSKYNIRRIEALDDSQYTMELNISDAFAFSHEDNMYMSQCYHHQVGLLTPSQPPKPELDVPESKHQSYDWILAPFGRSAPEDQKWQNEKWQQLIYKLKEKGDSVCVFGNSTYDFKDQFYDCTLIFDRTMVEVLDILRKAKKGCISIMTGISHACFAMDTPNYILCNQWGNWGRIPTGKFLETYIPEITVDDVLNFISCQ